ncbi:MAG: sugar ABC transporter ATP-binding protein [Kiritimatiellae bacterium]|nr:sugar ABC transporter ATP-binding protein [Kiritimatiellia bacterium]
MENIHPIIRFEGIGKRFPGVQALRGVNLEIRRGTCHALIGENGAGKSTLGKILAGLYQPDEGRLILDGRAVGFRSPRDAFLAGIGIVHQELAFCENLSVAENLCLGSLPAKRGFICRRSMKAMAEQTLAVIDASLNVETVMAELSMGQQQLVQIAGALAGGARIIVFDEPTSSLSQVEARRLFKLVKSLPARGITSIYISHRLEEIFELCDNITVLRDGCVVATKQASAVSEKELAAMMIGRSLDAYYPRRTTGSGGKTELLRVKNLSSPGKFSSISFSVNAGEIVGLAGLVGSGRTEVALALFGLDQQASGDVLINADKTLITSPGEAMRHRIGLVPEDRKRCGLILSMNARENISLAILEKTATFGWVRRKKENELAQTYFDRLRVCAPHVNALAASLSGGNQQKLVVARWLAADCRLLIMDEPTRGVDVGAKAEIHGIIDHMARSESGILLISSELPEVINLSDRVLVMRNGRLAGELPRKQASQGAILKLMAGVAA